jgi:flagellar protein FlgJ
MNSLTQAFVSPADTQAVADSRALDQLKYTAKTDPKAALKETAEKFEAIFLQQMFKEMRNGKLADDMMGGQQTEFFQEMYHNQMADELAQTGSLGLANLIVKQLEPQIAQQTTSAQLAMRQLGRGE